MSPDVPRVDAIFMAAIKLQSLQERAAYLDRACGDDAQLRDRLEKLLAAHFSAGDFLESPASVLDVTSALCGSEPLGTIVGPYKLLEEIGEGGMGTVYMA